MPDFDISKFEKNPIMEPLSRLFTGEVNVLTFNINYSLYEDPNNFDIMKVKVQEFFDETLVNIETYMRIKINPFAEVNFKTWVDKLDIDVYQSFSKKFTRKDINFYNVTGNICRTKQANGPACDLELVETFLVVDESEDLIASYPIGSTTIVLSEYVNL